MNPPMFHTRHALEALLMTKAARHRASRNRGPSSIETVVGLGAFIAVAAFGLYLAAALAG